MATTTNRRTKAPARRRSTAVKAVDVVERLDRRGTLARSGKVQNTESGVPHANEVRLVGRLAVEPVPRELPSGDRLVSFRLVVSRVGQPGQTSASRRPKTAGGAASRSPTVDTLDCVAWRAVAQRTLGRAQVGEIIEVHGALRRRFWRSPGGPVSRTEVEVVRLRRVAVTT